MYKQTMEVFIHCYCINDFGRRLIQKYKRIKMSGLLDEVEKITVSVSNFRATDTKFFEDFKSLSPKIYIHILKNVAIGNECDTLNYIKEYVENFEQNKPILYLHTKGVSQIHPIIKKNVEIWTKYLDYWCIWKWKECVEHLKTHDTVGGLFTDNTHYCGNHYWINSDYIKTLPHIDKDLNAKINRGEFWISCNKNLKAYEMNDLELPEMNWYHDHYIIPGLFPIGF